MGCLILIVGSLMVVLYVENPSDCFQQLVEQEKLSRQFDFKSHL